MRKPIIAGNWKMNKNIKEALEFVKEVGARADRDDVEAVICAPFLQLKDLKEATKGTKIKVGAQNMHFETSGAFTGEVSAEMLQEIGMDYVIIGHSERREYFGETDETVNKKAKRLIAAGITPILCIGETEEEYDAGKSAEVIKNELKGSLAGLESEAVANMVIAYEPIWAIGTGKSASVEIAENCCKTVRDTVRELFGDKAADEVRIQYGGSVKPNNVEEYMAQPDIDGALIGGASLKEDSFIEIIEKTK